MSFLLTVSALAAFSVDCVVSRNRYDPGLDLRFRLVFRSDEEAF